MPTDYCAACRKESMHTWADAQARAAGLKRMGKGHMHPYACPAGHGFHLTSKQTRHAPDRKGRRGR